MFAAAVVGVGTTAIAAPTVDGTRDGEYGSALAVQTVQTQFGDDTGSGGGSEMDAGYGVITGGRLYLMLTGNIEGNFNKLEIFIDSKTGGQSVFDSSGNDNAGRMDGMVFDSGFTADYHIIARRGFGTQNTFDLDFANLGAQSASGYSAIFGTSQTGSGSTGTGVNAASIAVGFNSSNTAGVTGGTAAADQTAAAAVTTGLELSIDLADLGFDSSTQSAIRVMVGQNGGGHDFWSNQFLGGLTAPQGNLGGDGNGNFTGTAAINLQNFAGNQFFTVAVPEPVGVTILGGLGALAMLRRRRKA
jgi:hypothetical protein